MTYNTGNAIGSTDPRDLFDNAESLDQAMNSGADTWTDRLGNVRVTQSAIERATAAGLRNDLADPTDPAKGAGMVGFYGGSVSAALLARKCMPIEVLATKYGLPISNAGAVINAAWADGIGVFLGPQLYTNNTPIMLRNHSILIGLGSAVSGIKSSSGFTGNIIDTTNFAALQAAQAVSVSDPVTPVPHGFVLDGFYLDGNVLNYGGVVSSTNGFGIRIYGKAYSVRDIRLVRIPGVGFYSELPASGTYYNPDPQESKPFSPLEEYGGVGIKGLYIYDTGEEGMVFAGPADIEVDNVYVGWPAGSYRNEYAPGKTSKLFSGRTVDGAVIARSCELGFLHAFDNRFGWAVYVDRFAVGQPAVRLNAKFLMGENGFGNIYIGANSRYQIGMIDCHNNTGGDGSRPHLEIQSTLGGSCQNVRIKKEAGYLSENASDCARVYGFRHMLNINIETTSGQQAGRGVLMAAPLSDVRIHAGAMTGVPQSGGSLSYVCEVTSSCIRSNVEVNAQLCDGGFNFSSVPATADYDSTFKLISDRCTVPINGLTAIGRRQTRFIEATHFTGSGSSQRSEGSFVTTVNLSSTSEQVMLIAHSGLIAAPLIQNCKTYVVAIPGNTYTMPAIEKIYVSAVNSTHITAIVKFASGGSGQAYLCVDACI